VPVAPYYEIVTHKNCPIVKIKNGRNINSIETGAQDGSLYSSTKECDQHHIFAAFRDLEGSILQPYFDKVNNASRNSHYFESFEQQFDIDHVKCSTEI
jgi:hypothetical protein